MTNYPYSAYGPNPYSGNVNADNGWGGYKWPAGVPSRLLTTFDVIATGGISRMTFRSELVELVRLSFQIAAKHGYPIYARRNGEVWGPWSYENRAISGSSTASNHSRGRAWDINAPNNPYHDPLISDMPPAMVRDFESIGWAWGGRYNGRKDAMHFEYGYSPGDVPRHVAKAKAILGGVVTPPPPTGDDDMSAAELNTLIGKIDNLKNLLFQQGFDVGGHSIREEVGWATDKVIMPKLAEIQAAVQADAGSGKADTYACVVDDESGWWYAVSPGHFWHIENMMEVAILRQAGVLTGESHLNHGDVVHLRTMVLREPGPAGDPPPPATYTVKSGDTLGGIAKANNVTVQQLQQWNGVADPNNISVGQVLRLTAP